MKYILISLTALCLCIAPIGFTGCGYSGQPIVTTPIAPSESVVVKAEQTLRISKDTFDIFLRLEKDNHSTVVENAPQIHQFAEYLRRNAPNWLIQANDLKNKYKHGEGNLQALLTAIENLTANTNQAKTYINQLNGA